MSGKKNHRGKGSKRDLAKQNASRERQGKAAAVTGGTDVNQTNSKGSSRRPANSPQPEAKGINWWEAGQLILVIILIAAVAYFVAKPFGNAMKKQLGLDLQGGVHAVYQAVATKETPVTNQAIDSLIGNFRKRVDQFGVTEPLIQKVGNNRVSVDLPGVKNPEEAVKQIGVTAHMEFKTEDGKTVLSGKDLQDAQAQPNPNNQEPEVSLKFNSEGAKIFSEVTTANVGKTIAIVLDNRVIEAPRVDEPIPSGEAVIHGGFKSLQEAQNLAVLLRSGALPVKVQLVEKRTVGPTLGKDSLDRSVKAGLIGLAFIFLFMLAYYRIPGIVADFSLIVYTLIVTGLFILIHATLTLPGIAGFILSIGMAVDANILIYERIKEELRAGKTLRSAFDAGFRHALRTILDCNVNTLIAAAVLYYFGSGPIRGFAVTLALGVLTSLFTAVTFTRYILHLLARSRLVLSHKAYGVS